MLRALLGVFAALLLFTVRSAAEPATAGAARGACNGVLVDVAAGKELCIEPGSGAFFKDCADCPEMVVAPAGGFTMGSPKTEPEHHRSEEPQHEVTIAKPFAVGRFEARRRSLEQAGGAPETLESRRRNQPAARMR